MTEPERWTDAEWAAEQVALARRQAEVARAEARETERALEAALAERDAQRDDLAARYEAVVAERDKLRADLDAVRVGTIDHERMAALEAQLAETRAALEAARAAVHTPSPGVDDRRWSHPARDEGPDQRLVDGIVDAASAARRGAPRVVAEGRDPATRTRALPVVPTVCEGCEHEAGSYCHHPLQLCCEPVKPRKPPPVWCKVRAELAKAGGA